MTKAEFIEKYGEEKWLKRLEYRRNYHKEHRNELLEYRKNYRKTHREDINNYNRNNKEKVSAYNSKYRNKKSGRARDILHRYSQRDINYNRGICTLTRDWIVDHIFNSSCIYCGDSNWKHLGADRIDDNLPHTPDNVVCACGICNIERANRKMSVEEFVEYRKNNPRDIDFKPPQKVVEINGIRIIKKGGLI